MRDASAPGWWAPYADLLTALGDPERIVESAVTGQVAARLDALGRARACPVRFVPAPAVPMSAAAYERCIASTRAVPTRDNLHDLFNGLVWLRFPAFKDSLHGAQSAALRAAEGLATEQGRAGRRGPLRDALTLLDESGALLQGPAELVLALRERDWQQLFVTARAAWQEACLVIVGHALLEKLYTAPRPAQTAQVWLADDAARDLARKPFVPLPILGVPGWWNPNEDPSFYSDTSVFRPRPTAVDAASTKGPIGPRPLIPTVHPYHPGSSVAS